MSFLIIFFSSVRLLEHLRAQRTFACATVRVNRKDLPAAAKKKLRPGEKVVRQKGRLVFTKWHDKRDVSILSTSVSPVEDDVVVQRHRQQVQKPAVISLYNKHMGGVDLADQLRKYYSVGRSSRKWYRYLFWFCIDVSICNAYILCNHFRVGQGRARISQVKFRTELAKELVGGFSSCVSAAQSTKRRKIERTLAHENAGKHFSDKIQGRKRQCVFVRSWERKLQRGGQSRQLLNAFSLGWLCAGRIVLHRITCIEFYFFFVP